MTNPQRPDQSAGTTLADADESAGEAALLAADPARLVPPGLPLRFLAESRCVCLFVLDGDLAIRAWNPAVEALSARPAEWLGGRPVTDLLWEESACALAAAGAGEELGAPFALTFVDAHEAPHTLSCRLQAWQGAVYVLGEPLIERERALADVLLDAHVRGRLRARGAFGRANENEMDGSHWHIRKLQEHLPICAVCHRVHEPGARWETLSAFLQRNGLRMTHGYCPDCEAVALDGLNSMYPDKRAAG
jgi:PAS domain-containing protein